MRRHKNTKSRTIFITGTDTGVGKTLMTGLLLAFLRSHGVRALAMKPFCAGSRGDAQLIVRLQDNTLSIKQVNPFYFPAPVAPLVAARYGGGGANLGEAVAKIQAVKNLCDWLIVEGAGGLMVPLGDNYFVRDLVAAVASEVVVVAPNRLGVINHVLLTVQSMQAIGIENIKIVLMNHGRRDMAVQTNRQILTELLRPRQVFDLPYLGHRAKQSRAIKKNFKKNEKTLARIFGIGRLSASERAKAHRELGRKKSQKKFDSPRGDGRVAALFEKPSSR